MSNSEKTKITVSTKVNANLEKAWDYWTQADHITRWNFASDEWCCPRAENDLKTGGKFSYRMESTDGAMGFDFNGVYTHVEPRSKIEYELEDGRAVEIDFREEGPATLVTQTFEAENMNSIELQRGGWQAIMDNYKKHVERNPNLIKLHFEVKINAPAEKVYQTMLDKKHYTEWTAPFSPGSYFEGSWEEGSDIYFLGTDQEGNLGGMVSRIKVNRPNSQVSIEHLGMMTNGKAVTTGPEVEAWAGSLEEYFFIPEGDGTLLKIQVDTAPDHKDYFVNMWPESLKILKEISESK